MDKRSHQHIFTFKESEEWKERRLLPMKTNSQNEEYAQIIYDMNFLSSLLPNKIVFQEKEKSHIILNEICFLYVKICGVTQYSEDFDRCGCYNPNDLFDTLETFFEPILHIITAQGGDIVKFTPDEIWSIWEYSEAENSDVVLTKLIHNVINCALRIQKLRDLHRINSKNICRVRIGISIGPFAMFRIDFTNFSHWICTGRSLFEVRDAVRICLPGQILLCTSNRVELIRYYYLTEEYSNYIKILGVGPNWREIAAPANSISSIIEGKIASSCTSSEETLFNVTSSQIPPGNDDTNAAFSEVYHLLKTLPQPLAKCLHLNKPISSIRKIKAIIVMHINVEVVILDILENNTDLIGTILRKPCSIIKHDNGFLYSSKVGRKNIQIVFVFGVENQTYRKSCEEALENATTLFIELEKLKHLKTISIALISGMCFSGVIDTSKKSYILVSSSFKKASRLVKTYPGKIICDKLLKLHSDIQEEEFTLLEYQKIKEYEPGPVFEYMLRRTLLQESFYPYLENYGKFHLVSQIFHEFCSNFEKRRIGKFAPCDDTNVVVINGCDSQGKSRILVEFARQLKSTSSRLITLSLVQGNEDIPYFAVIKMFETVMNFRDSKELDDKKIEIDSFLKKLQETQLFHSLSNAKDYSNFEEIEILKLKSRNETNIILEDMFKRLAFQCFDDPFVLAIDDAVYMDIHSCNVIYEMTQAKICFLLIVIPKDHDLSVETERLIGCKNSIKITLENLSPMFQATLACQILNVQAISEGLERIIRKASEGNPGKIEKLLFNLLEKNRLLLKTIRREEMKDMDLIVPLCRLTEKSAQHSYPLYDIQTHTYTRMLHFRLSDVTVHDPQEMTMEASKQTNYKYCIVPLCTNTTTSAPGKIFISIPRNEKLRKKWCKSMKREHLISLKSTHHCCQDHFDGFMNIYQNIPFVNSYNSAQ